MQFQFGNRTLALLEGDITQVAADAIGNAANSQLAGGGGADGAIHRVGGAEIMRALDGIRKRIGRCQTGDAVLTTAGDLPARWVIHAVGPIYQDGSSGESELLRSCYRRCLELAGEQGAAALTLPSISTGVYGYPMNAAAEIALGAVAEFLETSDTSLQQVSFVLFGRSALATFAATAGACLATDRVELAVIGRRLCEPRTGVGQLELDARGPDRVLRGRS